MSTNIMQTILKSVGISLLLVYATVFSATTEFTFSSPTAGQIFHVGDTIRITFDIVDSSVGLGRDMIGFSGSNGATRTWAFLPLFLNGDDTVSVLKHFDWVIPDSITSSRATLR